MQEAGSKMQEARGKGRDAGDGGSRKETRFFPENLDSDICHLCQVDNRSETNSG
jgi:hypothetical protein